MYTGRFYPVFGTIKWTKKYLFVFGLIGSVPVLLKEVFDIHGFVIPWLPIALIGTAVAFYLGFKNNASYERLWEARKIYGSIVSNSRVFTSMINNYVSNEFTKSPVKEETLQATKETIIKRHVAWLTALRFQLRADRTWEHGYRKDKKYRMRDKVTEYHLSVREEISSYISDKEADYIFKKGNPALNLLEVQMTQIKELRSHNLIDDFRHMEIGNVMKELMTDQGSSERIKNFPFPRQYATLNIYFVWLFIFLLPFGLVEEFVKLGDIFIWLCVPFTMVVSWVFHTMELIGDYSENPFEGTVNDVPITTISYTIERDIFDMINYKHSTKRDLSSELIQF